MSDGIIGKVTYECEECGTKHFLNDEDFCFEAESGSDRGMGEEVQYVCELDKPCHNCGNEMRFKFEVWEYPVGIINMTKYMIRIRHEIPSDAAAIEAVTIAAFRSAEHSSGTEHFIVRALRNSGQLTVSLVAEADGRIVGHAAVSPVRITTGSPGWYGLGPVSVVPEQQGKRIGTMLITQALEELRTSGAAGCVVLGEPGYYSRFGFRTDPGLVLPGVPAEYFQVITFGGTSPAGEVAYHASFEATA